MIAYKGFRKGKKGLPEAVLGSGTMTYEVGNGMRLRTPRQQVQAFIAARIPSNV